MTEVVEVAPEVAEAALAAEAAPEAASVVTEAAEAAEAALVAAVVATEAAEAVPAAVEVAPVAVPAAAPRLSLSPTDTLVSSLPEARRTCW